MTILGSKSPIPDGKTYPSELRDILERATQGDAAVLPQLQKVFDDNPELVKLFGDLAKHAEESLLAVVASSCLTAKEAIGRELAQLRENLTATATTELEKLLCDRVALCWLHVTATEVELAVRLRSLPVTSPTVRATQQRLDRAHSRFLSASRSLATVQKLRPGPSPLDLISRPLAEKAADNGCSRRATSGRFHIPAGVG